MGLQRDIEAINLNPAMRAGHPDYDLLQVFRRWDFRAETLDSGMVRIEAGGLGEYRAAVPEGGGVAVWRFGGGDADRVDVLTANEAHLALARLAIADEGAL